jgi:hypothetical protein
VKFGRSVKDITALLRFAGTDPSDKGRLFLNYNNIWPADKSVDPSEPLVIPGPKKAKGKKKPK